MSQTTSRRRFKLTIREAWVNREKVRHELDAFWTYGVDVLGVEKLDDRQVWTLEADRRFNYVWRNENSLPYANTIRKATVEGEQ